MRRDRPQPHGPGLPTTEDVRAFWERNPVAAASVRFQPGTAEFFGSFERLRQIAEPEELQEEVYAYGSFAGSAVLEVGCGNGYILSRYARQGARVWGVDLTWTAIDLSSKRFALENSRGQLAQADAERLPFRDAVFDLVVSAGVLHHVPHIDAAIAEIRRVLKPGGVILLMLYHRNSLHYRLLYPLYGLLHPTFRGHRPAEIARRIDGADNPIGRTYTRREMGRLLASFHEVRLRVGSLPIRQLLSVPGGKALLDFLANRLGWFLYARAVK
jgi:SAM-dependent methyltransferase